QRWPCGGRWIADAVIPCSALHPAWGNQTSGVTPAGRVAFSHYADPGSGNIDYSLIKLADGTELITSYGYDALGRMVQKVMPKGNAGRTIDANGNLGGSPDLTYSTAWAYYGLTEQATPPAACGGSARSQAGLPKSKTPHGISATTVVYDLAGRP